MGEPWIPSDDLLERDPIAAAKVEHPHAHLELSEAGIVLPDSGDDDLNEAAAAAALAEADDGEDGEEPGGAEDDDAIDDPHDGEPVPDDL